MEIAVAPDVMRVARLIVAAGYPAGVVTERTQPYRVGEAAQIIGVSKATMYREVQRGHCAAHRVGMGRGAIRIPVHALAEYQRWLTARAATHPAKAVA